METVASMSHCFGYVALQRDLEGEVCGIVLEGPSAKGLCGTVVSRTIKGTSLAGCFPFLHSSILSKYQNMLFLFPELGDLFGG